jgi:hypothetical protein
MHLTTYNESSTDMIPTIDKTDFIMSGWSDGEVETI